MKKNECERLIAEYLGWLKQGLRVNELEACCQISTPFLDRHNDEIEIHVEKRNGGIVLTDDGYTIADLEATGMSFETEKRKAHLQSILNGFGVRLENKEVIVGGESGPGARPMEQAWVMEIRDQSLAAGVPFFFKQWGGTNKKKAGRLLDGRTWEGLPATLIAPGPAARFV